VWWNEDFSWPGTWFVSWPFHCLKSGFAHLLSQGVKKNALWRIPGKTGEADYVEENHITMVFQKNLLHVFSHMWNTDLIQIQQYHEKQVLLRGGHLWEEESKRRKLRRWIWLMYFLYKNEYRIFKPVETGVERRKIERMKQFGL
jgi:hypothetical protein